MVAERLIAIDSVVKRFAGRGRAGKPAVDRVDLRIARGEILGLVGPNGAGKTTLLRMIAGRLAPNEGSILVDGAEATGRRARRLVSYVPEPPVLPPLLTGLEWLRYLAAHRASTHARRLELQRSALDIGAVQDFAMRRIGELSRGMTNQLALAGAVILGRAAVVLDETLGSVDPLEARSLRVALARLAQRGRAVVVASHDLATLERVATSVVVLNSGRVVARSSMAALLAERVAEIDVDGRSLDSVRGLSLVFPQARATGTGIAVPLKQGVTVEGVLAVCRANRIAVSGSRVRYRALEDLLVDSVVRGQPN